MKKNKCVTLMISAVTVMGLSACSPITQNETINVEVNDSNQNTVKDQETNIEENTTVESSDTSDTCKIYVPNVEALNIRSNPEHNSNLVKTVHSNEKMMFYGEIGQGYGSDGQLHDWYKIYLYSGETGWVRSDLIYTVDQVNINGLSNGSYKYSNGEFLSECDIRYDDGVKKCSLGFWFNYGNSPSMEDFFFEWIDGKYEYEVKGNRANKMFHLKFTPTDNGVKISVVCIEGTYYDWESQTESEVWSDVEYAFVY